MDFTYILILVAVLAISPFILKLAASQKKETKQQLKIIFLITLLAQIILGFLNWRSYPNLLLGLFLGISLLQFFLLILNKIPNILVILNFLNSALIFTGMIQISNALGYQIISLSAIGAVFLVLIGNVVGLLFINKDKNLLKKYP